VLRDDDLVARWGGEEFLLALPEASADAAVEVMDRIRSHLTETLRGGQVQFTASFGVTDSTMAGTLQELIQLADVGLYLSKSGGRDRVTVGERAELIRTEANGNGAARRTPAMHQVADDDDHQTA
jgi:diguanylate cyclase (GGDEF)-like protein